MSATPAQRVALEAIRDGKVRWYTPWGSAPPHWHIERNVTRADVVRRCVGAGWARVGPRTSPLFAPVVLTDSGIAELGGSAPAP